MQGERGSHRVRKVHPGARSGRAWGPGPHSHPFVQGRLCPRPFRRQGESAALCRELDARPVAPQGLCCCPLALVLCAVLLSCPLALPRALCPQQLLWEAFQNYSFECLSPILLSPPCPPTTALSQHQAASASVQFANPSWRSLTLPTQTPWRQGPSPLRPAAVSTSPQLPLMAHCPSPQRWSPVCFIPTPFSSLPVAQTSETETLLCSGPGDQTQSRQPIAAAGSHLWVCCTDGP